MFRKANQPGIITILHAEKKKPLKLWDKHLREGELKRIIDPDLKNPVLELTGTNSLTNYISCPADVKEVLGIRYPYLHMTIKTLPGKFFAFDVQILDDKGIRRRLRGTTVQGFLDVQPFMSKIPMSLEEGWNEITIPLHHYTKDLYNTKYVETLRIQIYASCDVKRIYFSDKEYKERDLPKDSKIFDFEEVEEQVVPKKPEVNNNYFGIDLSSFLTFFAR